jgi:hypothetical protein
MTPIKRIYTENIFSYNTSKEMYRNKVYDSDVIARVYPKQSSLQKPGLLHSVRNDEKNMYNLFLYDS